MTCPVAQLSVDQDADRHLPRIRELASGVDALYLSGYGEPVAPFLQDLEETRKLADLVRQPLAISLNGEQFNLFPHGFGRYRYLVVNDKASIGITTSEHLPPVRVQPRSSLLHAIGPHPTVEYFRELLSPLLERLSFSVNRLDLYADFQGIELDSSCRERFVCRAETVRVFEQDGAFTGIQLGMRKTKTFSARIYNKTTDIARTGSDWWPAIWGTAYDPSLPVWRFEFEIGRQALTEFGIDTPEQVLAATGDLWRYATEEWLTFRTPARTHRARWPLAQEWIAVQRARLGRRSIGVDRVRAGQRSGTIRRIFPALAGYLATFAAAIGTTDIEDTLIALDAQLRNDEIARRMTFEERVTRRTKIA
jgi:hypothetical protein